MDNKYFTSCRICLSDGATLPIFDCSDCKENLLNKINLCVSEKVEDIMGFPRSICGKCNVTVDIVYNFINKYKETCKILANESPTVKKEFFNDYSDSEDCNNESEACIETKEIKKETDCCIDDEELEPMSKVVKKVKMKGKNDTNKQKKLKNTKVSVSDTNKIASSILEGDFSWTGEKWCFKIGDTTIKSKRKRAINQKKIKNEAPKERKKNIDDPKEKQTDNPLKLCDLCGEVFPNSEKLIIHKRRKHFRTTSKCPKCPKTLASSYYLSLHIQRKHGGPRDSICSTCGTGFVCGKELRDHIKRVHNKVPKPPKVYTCKFCEKSYKCSKSVVVHERSAHTGYRPANCTVCGSSFYHEDYLKEHMRLHTGETPFKCPICDRGYAQKGNMKSHLRIHRISELDAATLSKLKPNYLKLLKVS